MTFYDQNIFAICIGVLKRHDLEFIKLEHFNTAGYLMSFTFDDKIIRLNEEALINEYNKNNFSIAFHNFIEILFYHELGHYFDKELDEITDRIKLNEGYLEKGGIKFRDQSQKELFDDYIKAELNANEIAKTLINKHDIDLIKDFEQITEHYLKETKRVTIRKYNIDMINSPSKLIN